MKLSQYGYDFSPEMLAKYPADNRDESRLMVINRAKGGTDNPIKAIGPQNAVETAVNTPVQINSKIRTRCTRTPRFSA